MAKHKSHCQKELHAKRKKNSYAQMEPAMKKQVFSNKAICFPAEKEKLLSHRGKWYKSLDPVEKKSFCPNQQIGVNHLVMQKNKIFCLAEQFGINH